MICSSQISFDLDKNRILAETDHKLLLKKTLGKKTRLNRTDWFLNIPPSKGLESPGYDGIQGCMLSLWVLPGG